MTQIVLDYYYYGYDDSKETNLYKILSYMA